MKIRDVARRTRQIQQQDVELFASMTGDRNPVHFDPELAARSRFGGIVVQGGVTSGLLCQGVSRGQPGVAGSSGRVRVSTGHGTLCWGEFAASNWAQ